MRSFILHENRWTPQIQVEAFVYAPLKMVDSTFQVASSSFGGIQWNLLFLVEINKRTLSVLVAADFFSCSCTMRTQVYAGSINIVFEPILPLPLSLACELWSSRILLINYLRGDQLCQKHFGFGILHDVAHFNFSCCNFRHQRSQMKILILWKKYGLQ